MKTKVDGREEFLATEISVQGEAENAGLELLLFTSAYTVLHNQLKRMLRRTEKKLRKS
jgi:hypothetical protein